ncbi:MAG TPA: hypothetical protein VE153_00060, partial [Myxococcus sp.]|nr:hypothetical protein [Myxococcus sp.]
RGAVAGCAALAACTGAQVRPTPNAPCPDGALQAMKELGLRQGMQIDIHVRRDVRRNVTVFLDDGPIVSRVFESRRLPDDTLVKGRLWTKGENVVGRYTELELPNGRRYPVCLVLCDANGCPKSEESTSEQAAFDNAKVFTVVDVFE